MNWAKFGKGKEPLVTVFLLAMTLGNAVSAVKVVPLLRRGYQNFTIFYAAAVMVRRGQSHNLYDLSAQYRTQQEFVPKVDIRQAALPYNHPPFEALLFLPFTTLPYLSAYLLWNVLSGAMVAFSLVLLRKQFVEIGRLPLAFRVLSCTAFVPLTSGIVQGQDSVLLLFLLVVAFTAMEKENDVAAGAALAAGLFKFNLVLPLVFLLGAKRPRLLVGFAPVAALLVGTSLAMVGWHGATSYLRFLFRLENSGAGGAIVAADMPNLRGMIAAFALARNGTSLMPLTIACSAVAIAIACWRMGSMRDSVRFAFVLATATAILVSYHTLTYDLNWLLPALLLLFAAPAPKSSPRSRADRADIVLIVLLYLAPLFEPFWPRVNQFGWPVLVLFWLFWKLGHSASAEPAATL
jgi:hypothetical protein